VHTGEIAYVFGNLPAGASAADRATSEAMATRWLAFAQRGRPQVAGQVDWPAYARDEQVLSIGPDGLGVGADPTRPRLDFLDRAWPFHIN
jgi:para-nitrobenzyl esterase